MDADLHWTEADAELARAETLALLKRECPKCPDLDELLTILRAPDIAGALGERPEHEYSIAWMPTFTDESLGDAGEDWEVLSWDATRVAILRRRWDTGDWSVEVRNRPEADED